jgi:hypothetical protein
LRGDGSKANLSVGPLSPLELQPLPPREFDVIRFLRPIVRFLPALVVALSFMTVARAERPRAFDLLPDSTLALIRVADAPDLINRFKNTSGGRMSQDPQLKPLFEHLYGKAVEAFTAIENEVGLPLPKILALPKGELCVAMIGPDVGKPVVVAWLDAGDQIDSAQKLLARATEVLDAHGLKKTEETIEGTKLFIYDLILEGDPSQLVFFEKDKTIVGFLGKNKQVVEHFLARWDGRPIKVEPPAEDEPADTKKVVTGIQPLTKNARYTAIMSRCRGEKNDTPQITWFVDPIGIFQTFARGNLGMTAALAFFPRLGLDGLSGAGGNIFLDTEAFDALHHAHILLENPRAGVLEAIALKSGDLSPPAWVPADVTSYISLHWDGRQTFDQVARLINSYRGKDFVETKAFADFHRETGVDFQKDILDNLHGRLTYIQWFDRPVRLDSQAQLIAVQVKDPKAAQETFDKLMSKAPERDFTKKELAGVTYYQVRVPGPRTRKIQPDGTIREEKIENTNPLFEGPSPCFGIVGDVLIATDKSNLFTRIATGAVAAEQPLSKNLHYKLVASRIARLAGGRQPGAIMYSQPEEGMRFVYDLATSEDVRKSLSDPKANQFFKTLDEALTKNPLPPYNVISQYLAPAGALVINEETGLHYVSFGLKREKK